MTSKRTVVLGASPNPARYAYLVTLRLKEKGHLPFPLGTKDGTIDGMSIITGKPELENIDTITLYLNSHNQREWYDWIFNLNPKRLIFNPGSENPDLARQAQRHGIETVEACTLVMLSVGSF